MLVFLIITWNWRRLPSPKRSTKGALADRVVFSGLETVSARRKWFVGTSANALKTQLWTALIAMLVVKYLQLRSDVRTGPLLQSGGTSAAAIVCLP